MMHANLSFSRLTIAALTLGLFAACGFQINFQAKAQEAPAVHAGYTSITGLPEDWTHHHVVFSNPGTEEDAIRKGTYDQWLRIVNDPRYVMQQLRRDLPAQGSAADDVARFEDSRRAVRVAAMEERNRRVEERYRWPSNKIQPFQPALDKDWSMALGSTGTKVGAGMYPAKYQFSTTAAVNCASAATPDYVVYNTSVAGSTTQASVVAYDNLYSGCSGQVPSVYWAFNTGGTVVTSVVLSGDGTQLAFMQTPSSGSAQLVLLRWKAAPTGRNVTATVHDTTAFTVPSGTLTAMDVGATVSGTDIPTGDTIATVTSGTVGTLETAASGAAGGTSVTMAITADAGSPDTLTSTGASGYSGCTAPCMTTLSLAGSGTRSDTISSPYYDYISDTLYVGDASGGLHKFHPVFVGTPAEVGSPWAAVSTEAAPQLSSPVYDSAAATPSVFVGDGSGYLYSVDASSGAVTQSYQVAVSPGIVDGPVIDSTNNQLYAITATDTNANNTGTESTCSGTNHEYPTCNAIINLPIPFSSTTEFKESVIGVSPDNTIYDGAFDNLYWTTGTGNIYAVGGDGSNEPKLMETPVTTAGIANTSTACANSGTLPNCSDLRCANNIDNPMTNAAAAGSPVTEFLNGTTDYIFASVTASGNLTGCTGDCIYSWNVKTVLAANATPLAGGTVTGGASGTIVDNTDTGGGSQVYFSTLANATCTTSGNIGATNTGCAIQAAQSGP